MRHIITIAAIAAAWAGAYADIPEGYYTDLNGKKDAELKTACWQTVRNLTRISSYSNLPKYFQVTDVYPESDRWWDMYSDIPLFAPSFSGLNREHSFPKSWWGGLTDVNAYTDLNHLYPSEMKANTAKSNYPLGTVDRTSPINFQNGVSTVGYAVTGQGGGARYVFEPADEYKGDFARTYFYMVTCYQDYTWNQNYMYMLQQNTYPTLNEWSVRLLLDWAAGDPVSQKEIDRNEAVYGFQNNRNPFIDFPQLAEYIWGNKRGEIFYIDDAGTGPGGEPNLITPTQGMDIDFGQVAIGRSTTAKVYFHGEHLAGDLSLTVYSGDKAMFSIPARTIPATLVNSADGYWLTVTYTPTATGEHTTRLLISDGGLDGSRGITLRGECLDVPQLGVCTALDATDITSTSYTANWSAPADDVIDYYVVTRTVYMGNTVRQVEQVAEDCSLTIDDFGSSDRESYYVQSSRLGYLSDPSNVIFVDHSGIADISAEQPLVVIGLDGAVRIVCSAPQTGARIYDITGRLVTTVAELTNNTDIDLPQGVYLVVTDQARTPRRVIVR